MKLTLAPIVQRLRDGGALRAEGLIEFVRQIEAPRALPAYFVVPLRERAEPNGYAGGRDQRVSVQFGVVVVLGGDDRRREGVSDALSGATGLAIDALTGWRHPQAAAPTDYAGAELISTDNGLAMCLLTFSTRYHERKPT